MRPGSGFDDPTVGFHGNVARDPDLPGDHCVAGAEFDQDGAVGA